MRAKLYQTHQDTLVAGPRLDYTGELDFRPRQSGEETKLFNIYPQITDQTLTGIGGAATEAAAWCWHSLSEENRERFLKDYFCSQEGIGYSCVRIHIGCSDFSLTPYSHIAEGDTQLITFSVDRDREYIIPFLKAAQKYTKFTVLGSIWSPPPFMKDNQSWVGGSLLPQHYDTWAKYIAKFIEAYGQEGIPIQAVTIQNEPEHRGGWETCGFTAQQERDFAKVLATYAKPLGVKIYFWDHNRQDILRRAEVMYADDENRKNIDGIATHLYSGAYFEELAMFRHLYPDRDVIFSEGCTYDAEKGIKTVNAWNFGEKYAYELMRNFQNGVTAFYDWNMALNIHNGPSNMRENRPRQCDAPVIVLPDGSYRKNPSFYYIGHFSKFLRPGAVRLGTSLYSEELLGCAFRDPDGSIVAILLNRTEREMPVKINLQDQIGEMTLPAHSIVTVIL